MQNCRNANRCTFNEKIAIENLTDANAAQNADRESECKPPKRGWKNILVQTDALFVNREPKCKPSQRGAPQNACRCILLRQIRNPDLLNRKFSLTTHADAYPSNQSAIKTHTSAKQPHKANQCIHSSKFAIEILPFADHTKCRP